MGRRALQLTKLESKLFRGDDEDNVDQFFQMKRNVGTGGHDGKLGKRRVRND